MPLLLIGMVKMNSEEAIQHLNTLLDSLTNVTDQTLAGWRHRAIGILERVFGSDSRQLQTFKATKARQSLSLLQKANNGIDVDRREIIDTSSIKSVLSAFIEEVRDSGLPFANSNMDDANIRSVDARNVFVVHGRNGAARKAMFSFLRSLGLHPLEWSEIVQATGEGSPYIGKVLTTGFGLAQAVVVMMTPDDEARLRTSLRGENEPLYESELTPQPRPNVLIEAGIALGIFPNRSIIVEIGKMRPVSDLFGRHVVRMSNSVGDRQELARRLSTAGCAVNLNGQDWHAEGDFESCVKLPPVVEAQADSSSPGFVEYLDGLSGDELYRLAMAVKSQHQTITCGRNDSVSAILVSKGILEKVPFDSDLTNAEVPHTIPIAVWRYLNERREWLLETTIARNQDRADRLKELK